jgi:uncharacterized protein (DUF1501 family)
MAHNGPTPLKHPVFSRRDMLQAGTIGLMGLSLADVAALQAATPAFGARPRTPRAVIYIFLSGGLSQHDSFDPKPDAPDTIRGEFQPIATRTPGLFICEHLPRLAARSNKWALVRSLSHPSNDHSLGHHIMLTGRSEAPPGFNAGKPEPTDFPSLAAVAGYLVPKRNHLPSAAVLPFPYTHHSGRIVPGQFAGQMGARHDPWIVPAAHNCPRYGACPNCFDHERRPGAHVGDPVFEPPALRLAEGLTPLRFGSRRGLLDIIERQQRALDRAAAVVSMDRYRATATSMLTSGKVRAAFDLDNEKPEVLDAYGRNLFGWSCLLARRLVEVGVGMVQVNLGRNETWDTHGNIFPVLKDDLLPPTDQCLSALIDDLDTRGLLASTLIVMAGEFGRTPKVSNLPQFYELPGRDHWGAVQTVFFAGGGVKGGTVIGESDRLGAFPKTGKQTPENMAATIYQALGLDQTAHWYDATNRPFFIFHADPIDGLTA